MSTQKRNTSGRKKSKVESPGVTKASPTRKFFESNYKWIATIVVIGVVSGFIIYGVASALSVGQLERESYTNITTTVYDSNGINVSENATVSVYMIPSTSRFSYDTYMLTPSNYQMAANSTADKINVDVVAPVVVGDDTIYTRFFAKIVYDGFIPYYKELYGGANAFTIDRLPETASTYTTNSTGDISPEVKGEFSLNVAFSIGKIPYMFNFSAGCIVAFMLNFTLNDTITFESLNITSGSRNVMKLTPDEDAGMIQDPTNHSALFIVPFDIEVSTISFDISIASGLEVTNISGWYGCNNTVIHSYF